MKKFFMNLLKRENVSCVSTTADSQYIVTEHVTLNVLKKADE